MRVDRTNREIFDMVETRYTISEQTLHCRNKNHRAEPSENFYNSLVQQLRFSLYVYVTVYVWSLGCAIIIIILCFVRLISIT